MMNPQHMDLIPETKSRGWSEREKREDRMSRELTHQRQMKIRAGSKNVRVTDKRE